MRKHNFIIAAILAIIAFILSIPEALGAPFKAYWKNMVDSRLFLKTPMRTQAMSNRNRSTIDAEITVTLGAVGAQSGHDTVAIQFLGSNGKDAVERYTVQWYLSNDADGNTKSATSTDVTTLAIGTDGLLIELSDNVAGLMTCESDGDVDLALVIPTGKAVYLVLVMPDGHMVISSAISYATS